MSSPLLTTNCENIEIEKDSNRYIMWLTAMQNHECSRRLKGQKIEHQNGNLENCNGQIPFNGVYYDCKYFHKMII